MGVDFELVLGIGCPAGCAGFQVAALIAGTGAGFFHTAHAFVFQAADPLVAAVQHAGPFAIQAGAAVGEALLIQGIG